jgi:hypothetical protein
MEEYTFNDYIGIETLFKEYKKFAFNLAGLVLDSKLAEEYCLSNKFDFNEAVIINLKRYIKIYGTINACAFFNANIDGDFMVGIDDDGFVEGIPYHGELPVEELKRYIYKILSENLSNPSLGSIDYNKYVKINITKINKPEKPVDKVNPLFSKFLKRKNRHLELLQKYDEDIKDWRIRFEFVNQKLFRLINNIESRIILIEFIKSIDKTSSVIDLLYTDYQEEYKQHDKVVILKEDISSPYYWITRWKDMMIKKLRKEKPIFIKSLPSTPTNLIMNVSEMIPWWMHNNDDMNLYIVHIQFETSKFDIKFEGDNLFSYLDYKKNWLRCHRTIINGGPSCFPI